MGQTYSRNLRVFFVFCLVCSALFVQAQRTITGTVTDATTGETLVGANVFVKGGNAGTVTDLDGHYSLVVPDGYDVLTFSYTGFTAIEFTLLGENVVDIALSPGQVLDEVVVIGYGTVKREDATGSVQTVSSESFNKGAITGPQELLAGKIPGVVITTGGAPGEGSTIRIRGESSLSATNDPLIVIDGVPLDNGGVSGGRNPLNVINPNDIESFTVLKDASAAAIYGNRAAGGVILITTKKGAVGQKLRVGYSGNVSFSKATDFVPVLHADEYRALVRSHYDSTTTIGMNSRDLLGDADTYWQDEIYQSAIGHDHNLYASGALARVPFRVSLGYTDKDGILKSDNFNRISAGVNVNPSFLDNTLQINLGLKSMFSKNQFADRGAIGNALGFDPTHPVRDTIDAYGGFWTWKQANGNPILVGAPTNPVALLELRDDHSDVKRYIANFTADYRFFFLPELRANLNLAYDHSFGEGAVIVPNYASFAFDATNGGGVNNRYDQTKDNRLLEFYLNYKKQLGKSDFDVLGGYSWQHFEVDNTFMNSDAAGTPSETTSGSDPAEYYLVSLFGRVNYTYNERYLLTVTLRRDGTSRFSPDNRWGLFPAVAGAIKIIDNEDPVFNSLKVRAGWGVTGQQDIGDYYAYLARYQLSNESARYQFGEDTLYTLRPNGYDENIRWEETSTINLGLDFSIIRDRLSGTLDVYQRKTKDLLNRIPVPAGTNLTNFITTNVGNMENKGVELGLLLTPVMTSKVHWDVGANVAFNKSEITRLTATDDPEYQGVATGGIAGGVGSNIQIHTVGYAPASFYVFEQMYDENGNILEGQFVDRNNDGIINDEDKYRYEKPAPDVTFGLTTRLAIGNFDISLAGRASVGNYVYNNVKTDMGYLNRIYNSNRALWNVHESAVELNTVDQASLTFSDHFVVKGDFARIDHITAGYNFPETIGQFLRIYATVQNPFLFTGYDGLDPEIFGGIDNNIYPRSRTFLFGLNIEF